MLTMQPRKTKSRNRKSTSTAARTGRHPAFGALKGTVRIAPGVDLTEPAEPDWEKLWLKANEWLDYSKPPERKA